MPPPPLRAARLASADGYRRAAGEDGRAWQRADARVQPRHARRVGLELDREAARRTAEPRRAQRDLHDKAGVTTNKKHHGAPGRNTSFLEGSADGAKGTRRLESAPKEMDPRGRARAPLLEQSSNDT